MTFAARLAELMAELGYGVLRLARAVPCDQGHISRVMHGQRMPSAEITRRIDDILGAGGELVALRKDARRGAFSPERSSGRDSRAVAASDEVRSTSQMLVTMERRLGGNAVLPAAVQAFRAAAGAAGDDHDRLAAAAEAGEVAAWISYDAERPDVSRRLTSDALTLSREAGDRDMELFLASHITMLDIEQGRPESALRMSAAILDSRLPPRTEAVFRIRHGRALVRLGRDSDGIADLDRAVHLVSDGPNSRDPWWVFWATRSEVWWQQGTALADTGNWRAAEPLLRAAAETRSANHGARTVYHDQACLLEALVRLGAWNDAGGVLDVMIGAGGRIASARTAKVLRRAAVRATTGPGHLAQAIADLADVA